MKKAYALKKSKNGLATLTFKPLSPEGESGLI
jgi:hypothetical protein